MNNFRRWITLALIPLIILAVTVFMLENEQVVVINFFGWSSGEASLASYLVIALLIGMAIGPFFTLVLKGRRGVKVGRSN